MWSQQQIELICSGETDPVAAVVLAGTENCVLGLRPRALRLSIDLNSLMDPEPTLSTADLPLHKQLQRSFLGCEGMR